MAKRKTIGLIEAWWVWIGEKKAVRVDTKEQALSLLQQGQEYVYTNTNGCSDSASPVVEVIWNDPLPPGKTYHKTVISPVKYVLHNKQIVKVLRTMPPSKSVSLFKSWYKLEPELPAWYPNQYNDALNDPQTLVIKGNKSLLQELHKNMLEIN